MKLLDTVKARKLAYYGHNMRKQGESDNARQVHAGEEGHARPGWTTSRRGQDSAWKSPPEWQRTEINGESTSTVWPTIGSRTAKEQNRTCPRTEVMQHRGNIPVSVTTSWLAVDVMSRTTRTTLAKSATHSSNDIWTWTWIHPHTEHHIKKVKVVHTRLPSVGFWSRFLAVSLQVMWVINPAVGCHYFPPGLQLPVLAVLLLDEQRHHGCEQFA